MVSLLRVLDNPRDAVSWFRVLQLLEGVGPVHAARQSMTALRALLDDLSVERDAVPLPSQIERIRVFCEPDACCTSR